MGLGLYTKILDRLGDRLDAPTRRGALRRCRRRGLAVSTVIDVGASDGRWSKVAAQYLAAQKYFLVEANPVHGEALENLKRRWPACDYILAAAGDHDGTLYFNSSDPFGGLASHEPLMGQSCTELPAVRIDTLGDRHQLPAPFLIKLDTHGFEIPILEGAAATLKQTQILIIEAYNFTIAQDSLRFHELCAYLEARGFRCLDLFDVLYRPKDGCLWQMDLVFAAKDLPCFQDLAWN
ncbi:MAG: FkbM family methyltransferase [Oscillatoriales cyanobacterium SM2_2_1]|nr:FkbM family methyltransferase [Oscillatoriales cyanobacterium SM2_2_1]